MSNQNMSNREVCDLIFVDYDVTGVLTCALPI